MPLTCICNLAEKEGANFTFSCKPTNGKYRLILATAWSLHFCASSFGNAIELN